MQLATGNFAVSVAESCLCNNTAKAASIDCRDASGSLVVNASTFADGAQRCFIALAGQSFVWGGARELHGPSDHDAFGEVGSGVRAHTLEEAG